MCVHIEKNSIICDVAEMSERNVDWKGWGKVEGGWEGTNIDRQTAGHIGRENEWRKIERQWGRLERTFEIELRVDRKFNYVFFISMRWIFHCHFLLRQLWWTGKVCQTRDRNGNGFLKGKLSFVNVTWYYQELCRLTKIEVVKNFLKLSSIPTAYSFMDLADAWKVQAKCITESYWFP